MTAWWSMTNESEKNFCIIFIIFFYHLNFWVFLHSQYENCSDSHDIEVSMNKTDGRKQWSVRNESLTDGFWIMVAYELCMSAGQECVISQFPANCNRHLACVTGYHSGPIVKLSLTYINPFCGPE